MKEREITRDRDAIIPEGMEILTQVASLIERDGLLSAGQGLVLGVSGGADSLCLLDCLVRLGFPVVVAHLDHQLRPGAWREAEQVLAIARDYRLPAVIERREVRPRAGQGRSIEEAARIVRYNFLADVARERNLKMIATGHTADDQVETILMHLLRGAGLSGLSGMHSRTDLGGWVDLDGAGGLELIRPLLETTRVATEDHCRSIGLRPIQDPSNQDRSFFRNRLRLELIPLLETYNPALKDVVLRMGKVMRAETEFLQAITREVWQGAVRQAGQHALAIAHKGFVGLPRAVQRSLVREAFARLRPGVRDLGFDHVEQAVDGIVRKLAGVTEALPGGLEIVPVGEEVLIRRTGSPVELPQYPQLTSARARKLRSPGRLALAGGWAIHTQVTELTRDTWKRIESPARDTIAVDVQAAEDLIVRPARRGDRLRPFGMAGSAKISDIFVNEHVPFLARARWPLVVAGGTPVWVTGLRAAEDTRLSTSAKRAVCIRLEKHEGKVR